MLSPFSSVNDMGYFFIAALRASTSIPHPPVPGCGYDLAASLQLPDIACAVMCLPSSDTFLLPFPAYPSRQRHTLRLCLVSCLRHIRQRGLVGGVVQRDMALLVIE